MRSRSRRAATSRAPRASRRTPRRSSAHATAAAPEVPRATRSRHSPVTGSRIPGLGRRVGKDWEGRVKTRTPACLTWGIAAVLVAGCVAPPPAQLAESATVIEKLEVGMRKPAFAGASFGEVGTYEFVAA